MDLTQTILELKENTSQLLERWTTQSDKWDQQVQAKINELEQWRQGVRGEYPVISIYPYTKDFNNSLTPPGTYGWCENCTRSYLELRDKNDEDVSRGFPNYDYIPPCKILKMKIENTSDTTGKCAWWNSIGYPNRFLAQHVTFFWYQRYVEHSNDEILDTLQCINNYVMGDANWTDGNWHRIRIPFLVKDSCYKAIWPIVPDIPPHSSITVEIALFMIIPGVHDDVDQYIEPICNL
jgi:hypothetical protein